MSFIITKHEQKNIEELCLDHNKTLGVTMTDYIQISQWYMGKKGYDKEAIMLKTEDYMKVTSIQDNYYDLIAKYQKRDFKAGKIVDIDDTCLEYHSRAFNVINRYCSIYGGEK